MSVKMNWKKKGQVLAVKWTKFLSTSLRSLSFFYSFAVSITQILSLPLNFPPVANLTAENNSCLTHVQSDLHPIYVRKRSTFHQLQSCKITSQRMKFSQVSNVHLVLECITCIVLIKNCWSGLSPLGLWLCLWATSPDSALSWSQEFWCYFFCRKGNYYSTNAQWCHTSHFNTSFHWWNPRIVPNHCTVNLTVYVYFYPK